MQKRILFISDIHGHHLPFMKLLEHAKFNPVNDTLIIGGDMIDRGPDSGLVVRDVKNLFEAYPENVLPIIGNHEEMMGWYLNSRSYMWLQHGGYEAINSFNSTFKTEKELDDHLFWLLSLPLVRENKNFIFVHAGLDYAYGLKEQPRDVLWMTKDELYSFDRMSLEYITIGKKIVHGHTPNSIVTDDGIRISCDLGSGVLSNGSLALVDLSNNMYFDFSINSGLITTHPIKKTSISI